MLHKPYEFAHALDFTSNVREGSRCEAGVVTSLGLVQEPNELERPFDFICYARCLTFPEGQTPLLLPNLFCNHPLLYGSSHDRALPLLSFFHSVFDKSALLKVLDPGEQPISKEQEKSKSWDAILGKLFSLSAQEFRHFEVKQIPVMFVKLRDFRQFGDLRNKTS